MGTLGKVLQLLATCSVSPFIAACCGVPVDYGENQIRLCAMSSDNQPIPGLSINSAAGSAPEYYTTDENGEATSFPIVNPQTGGLISVAARDVEGEDNLGCFARTEMGLDGAPDIEVTMEPNDCASRLLITRNPHEI